MANIFVLHKKGAKNSPENSTYRTERIYIGNMIVANVLATIMLPMYY